MRERNAKLLSGPLRSLGVVLCGKNRIEEAHALYRCGDAKPVGPVMARPNFIELPTRDLVVSQVFFENIFGMKMTSFGPTYACTMSGDVDLGLQADPAEATRAPLPVIEVEDLDATLAAVTAAGAAVTKPIFSFPGGRRFQFLDPSGNELAAMQADSD
jgi:uncharacterized protein